MFVVVAAFVAEPLFGGGSTTTTVALGRRLLPIPVAEYAILALHGGHARFPADDMTPAEAWLDPRARDGVTAYPDQRRAMVNRNLGSSGLLVRVCAGRAGRCTWDTYKAHPP